MDTPIETAPRGIFGTTLLALRDSAGRAPLWLLCTLVPILPALLLAAPWQRWFAKTLEHAYEPGSLLAGLSVTFRYDHREALGTLGDSTAVAGAVAAFVCTLAYVFAAGGWLQVFLERTDGRSVQRFFRGGARYFWRFLRVYLLFMVLLHLGRWFLDGPPFEWLVEKKLFGMPTGELEELENERLVLRLTHLRAGLEALLFGWLFVWAIYTRTRLALHDTRSALWAGLCSFFTLMRHPLKCLVPMLLFVLLEGLVFDIIGTVVEGLQADLGPGSTWQAPALLGLLTLAGLVFAEFVRGARYAAAARTSRVVVPPLARPDPWAEHVVGGPGGPQYPIGNDEYSVSF